MAWQETCVMDERLCFVSACLEGGDSISELCRVSGISLKTGHKWLGRYRRDGVRGLVACAAWQSASGGRGDPRGGSGCASCASLLGAPQGKSLA